MNGATAGASGDRPAPTADLVLEGGSISVDGEGTLITTEQCLLHPNRNPDARRDEIEERLREHLGVDTVIWLADGLLEDHDTDGHVDNVAAVRGAGRSCSPRRPTIRLIPTTSRLAENAERLRRATDARGRRLEVIELGVLPGPRCAASRVWCRT